VLSVVELQRSFSVAIAVSEITTHLGRWA